MSIFRVTTITDSQLPTRKWDFWFMAFDVSLQRTLMCTSISGTMARQIGSVRSASGKRSRLMNGLWSDPNNPSVHRVQSRSKISVFILLRIGS